MIIAVLEIPEDDRPQTFFVDLDKVDQNDVVQARYSENIKMALGDDMKMTTTSYDASMHYGPQSFDDIVVELPCHVDDSVTLYIE